MTISMSCDIEQVAPTPERKASWHRTCRDPRFCDCPAHKADEAKSVASR